jgi:1-acylglycerone phosphate reductase
MGIQQKSVLITGCSEGGVGAAIAAAFVARGYHVFATARTPSKISESLRSDPNVTTLALDVTSTASIEAATTEVIKATGGRLDVLVNNAGMGLSMALLDMPIGEGRKIFELQYWGPLAMIKAFGEPLIRTKGCVVNVASVGGEVHFPFTSTPIQFALRSPQSASNSLCLT